MGAFLWVALRFYRTSITHLSLILISYIARANDNLISPQKTCEIKILSSLKDKRASVQKK
jgi:hypothetical protein